MVERSAAGQRTRPQISGNLGALIPSPDMTTGAAETAGVNRVRDRSFGAAV